MKSTLCSFHYHKGKSSISQAKYNVTLKGFHTFTDAENSVFRDNICGILAYFVCKAK